MSQKLFPLSDHMLVLPEPVAEGVHTNVGIEKVRESGIIEVVTEKEIKEKMKRVNKGTVHAKGPSVLDPRIKLDAVVLYYPYAKNEVFLGEVLYHIVREEDCMAVVENVSPAKT